MHYNGTKFTRFHVDEGSWKFLRTSNTTIFIVIGCAWLNELWIYHFLWKTLLLWFLDYLEKVYYPAEKIDAETEKDSTDAIFEHLEIFAAHKSILDVCKITGWVIYGEWWIVVKQLIDFKGICQTNTISGRNSLPTVQIAREIYGEQSCYRWRWRRAKTDISPPFHLARSAHRLLTRKPRFHVRHFPSMNWTIGDLILVLANDREKERKKMGHPRGSTKRK